ncbi:MAG: T9SS C-terminal target domain-containing protein, partial [Stygiobacter sp.]
VATLVDEYKQPGNYKVTFNARHLSTPLEMTSGVYFYQLRAGSFVKTKKLVLMK